VLKGGIPLGKFFGISVRLHWSWFLVFFLVTWSLAASYFPDTYRDWSRATCIVTGLATSILLFSSVLAHELAHSLVAKAEGIPIQSITLFIFGGVAQMTKEPERPGTEFRMALAGPATSLVIAGIFWAIYFATVGVSEPVMALGEWLGGINIALAIFNLIPGFPLDGGRVLRSILWWRSGNVLQATRIASSIGRGIGYLFIFGGIVLIFLGEWINGLWIAFIGWFLQNAAVRSYRHLAVDDVLRDCTANEVMQRDCPVIPPELTIERLVQEYVLPSGHRCFPVVEGGRLLGVVTIHDVKAVPHDLWPTKTAREVAVPMSNLKSVRANADLSSVLRFMTAEDINELLVVEGNTIVGIVFRDQLLSFINTHTELVR
jgi:Zn-dependent protease/CBS domain-containing protein